jgi:hypothetical protein
MSTFSMFHASGLVQTMQIENGGLPKFDFGCSKGLIKGSS